MSLLAIPAAPDDRVDVDNGQVPGEMVRGVIQDAAHRRDRAAHHSFHAVGRADKMAFVDAVIETRDANHAQQICRALIVGGHPTQIMEDSF